MSKDFADRRGGLEEEEGDEKCEHPSQHPSQDRGTLGKRARKMAGVQEQSRVHYIFILIVFFF
jgi:hypothetical protein